MWFSTNDEIDLPPFAGQAASADHRGVTTGDRMTPSFGALLVALMAMLTLQMFRAGHTRSLPMLWAEAVIFLALPLVLLSILRCRLDFRNTLRFTTDRFTTHQLFGFQTGAMTVSLLVLLWQGVMRVSGFGDANEIVALLVLQNVGWYLGVFSKVPGFEKASLSLNGALVFFVCCVADDYRVFVIAGLCAFAGLWWLLGQYWNRLESKAIDGDSQSLKLRGSVTSLTMLGVVLVVCLATAIPFSHRGIHLAGFMPFSGGEQGRQNEFSIAGVGDGNMLTAGDNATTTGAVESEQFIEDGKPSLYDIMSDQYEGPIVKARRNKTVALSGTATHLHEAKKSEQSGRTFRTMRNTAAATDNKITDRTTEALFFVEGSVPARFSINNFHRFDGWDWSSEPDRSRSISRPRITRHQQIGKTVFQFARNTARYLTGRRSHRVKIMRLDSSIIPAPALLQQWHIPLVNKLDMFCWSGADLVQMDIDGIASHTIIDLQSHVPNQHLLRREITPSHGRLTTLSDQTEIEPYSSEFLQIPETVSRSEIELLADQCTSGIDPGWTQVESIVSHFRSEYVLNPSWKVNASHEDSVHQFLEQGGGPTYMFATTCAMALRSAGFRTRLASGFLIQKKDYDASARQSVVSSDNVHVWPEVCLDGEFWIPVEPTPGYPIPYSTQTAWQWMSAGITMMGNWLWKNPVLVSTVIASLALAIWFHAECITAIVLGWWLVVRLCWPQGLLKVTRQLIDLRFWCAGDRRPSSQTIAAWYSRVESEPLVAFINLWNARNYSEHTSVISRHDLVLTCRNAIDVLSLKRIRETYDARSSTGGNS